MGVFDNVADNRRRTPLYGDRVREKSTGRVIGFVVGVWKGEELDRPAADADVEFVSVFMPRERKVDVLQRDTVDIEPRAGRELESR